MREIKFRAWDTYNKEFVTDYDTGLFSVVEFDCNGLAKTYCKELTCHCNPGVSCGGCVDTYIDKSEIIASQYTGLKDKNGVEIYEEDICKIDWNDSRYPPFFGTVRWIDDVCGWDFGGGNSSEVNWSHEVMGNIHENPELLALEKVK